MHHKNRYTYVQQAMGCFIDVKCFYNPSGSYQGMSTLTTEEPRENPPSSGTYEKLWLVAEQKMPLLNLDSIALLFDR